MQDQDSQRVDLDDCRVVSIDRDPDALSIVLEQRRPGVVRNLSARIAGPWREEIAYYVGQGVTAPHPNPSLPLDYVEYAAAGPSHLDLQGYLGKESWFAWRINGDRQLKSLGWSLLRAPPNNSFKGKPLRGSP